MLLGRWSYNRHELMRLIKLTHRIYELWSRQLLKEVISRLFEFLFLPLHKILFFFTCKHKGSCYIVVSSSLFATPSLLANYQKNKANHTSSCMYLCCSFTVQGLSIYVCAHVTIRCTAVKLQVKYSRIDLLVNSSNQNKAMLAPATSNTVGSRAGNCWKVGTLHFFPGN